ncbi:hypothetical protein HDV05_005812 [Chytridiales sp. JEL 0842]|nr:hypothetical protein HDV05_005812 [Chytridiales sp. JEL 0842]
MNSSTLSPLPTSPVSNPLDSINSLRFTFAESKYSCIEEFYYVHIVTVYIIFLSGIGCMITRVIPSIKWTHIWFGKIYIISMLISTACSLLIHNTGLPTGVIISFAWVMSGLSLGWLAIGAHQAIIAKKAAENVEKAIETNGGRLEPGQKLFDLINAEKGAIIERRTLYQRLVSWKAAHGLLMFLSWFNIAGRIFITRFSTFTCHTQPVYKPVYSKGNPDFLVPVPTVDPNYKRTPWADAEGRWAAITFFGPMVAGLLVGVAVAWWGVRKAQAQNGGKSEESVKA